MTSVSVALLMLHCDHGMSVAEPGGVVYRAQSSSIVRKVVSDEKRVIYLRSA